MIESLPGFIVFRKAYMYISGLRGQEEKQWYPVGTGPQV
jgi:hypothetical protein